MLDDAFDVFPIDTVFLIVINFLRVLVGGVLLRCSGGSSLVFIVCKGGLASWWTFSSPNVDKASVLVPVISQFPTVTYRRLSCYPKVFWLLVLRTRFVSIGRIGIGQAPLDKSRVKVDVQFLFLQHEE